MYTPRNSPLCSQSSIHERVISRHVYPRPLALRISDSCIFTHLRIASICLRVFNLSFTRVRPFDNITNRLPDISFAPFFLCLCAWLVPIWVTAPLIFVPFCCLFLTVILLRVIHLGSVSVPVPRSACSFPFLVFFLATGELDMPVFYLTDYAAKYLFVLPREIFVVSFFWSIISAFG